MIQSRTQSKMFSWAVSICIFLSILLPISGYAQTPEEEYSEQSDRVLNLIDSNDLSAAEELLSSIEPPEDYQYEHWYNLGVLQFDLERYNEAADSFQKAVDYDPESTEALFNLGTALLRDQLYQDAVTVFSRQIDIDRNSDAFLNRGNSYYALGEYDAAYEDYQSAIELDARNPDAHYNFGNLLYDRKEWEQAEESFTRALQLDTEFSEARFNRGNTRIRLGEFEGAYQDFSAIAETDPDYEDAQRNAALAEQLQNQLEQQMDSEGEGQ